MADDLPGQSKVNLLLQIIEKGTNKNKRTLEKQREGEQGVTGTLLRTWFVQLKEENSVGVMLWCSLQLLGLCGGRSFNFWKINTCLAKHKCQILLMRHRYNYSPKQSKMSLQSRKCPS